jgi:hypothetical protein
MIEQVPASESARPTRPGWLRTGAVGIAKHAAERYRGWFGELGL